MLIARASEKSILFVFLILTLKLNGLRCFNKRNERCPSKSYKIEGGFIKLHGVAEFKMKCEKPGYTTPWGYPCLQHIYTCRYGRISSKMPIECTEKTEPQATIKLVFMLLSRKKSSVCKTSTMLTGSKSQDLSSDEWISEIKSCVPIDDFTLKVVVHVTTKTGVQDTKFGSLAAEAYSSIYREFNDAGLPVVEYVSKSIDNSSVSVGMPYFYNNDKSIVDYSCDNNGSRFMMYRKDDNVCVGCGKGWFLKAGRCHPCGKGYYNDEEATDTCKACPIKYKTAPFAAVALRGCYAIEKPTLDHQVNTFAACLVPIAFTILMALPLIIASACTLSIQRKQNATH